MLRWASLIRICVLSGPLALAACAQDKEDALRDHVSRWISLGETLHFKSTLDCTAAVLRTEGDLTDAVVQTSTVTSGLSNLAAGQTVGFALPGQTPNDVSSSISSASLPEGIAVLSSGVSGANCLPDEWTLRYARALRNPTALFIFEKDRNTFGLWVRENRRIYVLRGGL